MGCCLSKLTKNYFASAMAANEMSKKIGMMGKYAPKEMKEGRSTYPGPTMEHLEEGLDILVGKMTSINEEAQEIVKCGYSNKRRGWRTDVQLRWL